MKLNMEYEDLEALAIGRIIEKFKRIILGLIAITILMIIISFVVASTAFSGVLAAILILSWFMLVLNMWKARGRMLTDLVGDIEAKVKKGSSKKLIDKSRMRTAEEDRD